MNSALLKRLNGSETKLKFIKRNGLRILFLLQAEINDFLKAENITKETINEYRVKKLYSYILNSYTVKYTGGLLTTGFYLVLEDFDIVINSTDYEKVLKEDILLKNILSLSIIEQICLRVLDKKYLTEKI